MTVARQMTTLVLVVCALFAAVPISPNLALADDVVTEGTGIGGTNDSQHTSLADSQITLRTADLMAGASELPFRDETVTAAVEPPCAEYAADSSGSLSAQELADEQAARDQELLDASSYGRESDVEPATRDLSGTQPTASISNQTDTMTVGEIVAVNAPLDN